MPRGIGQAGRPGQGGNERPNPFAGEDVTQTSSTNADGSVAIALEATTDNDLTVSRSLLVEDDSDAGVDITVENTFPDGETRTREISIDEDDDGGVDVNISFTTPDGESRTATIEIDEGVDAFDFSITRTNRDGEEVTSDRSHFWEHVLSDMEVTDLSVDTVAEALLDHLGVDLSLTDLSTIGDLA